MSNIREYFTIYYQYKAGWIEQAVKGEIGTMDADNSKFKYHMQAMEYMKKYQEKDLLCSLVEGIFFTMQKLNSYY